MQAEFRELKQELALWQQAGMVLPFWWRDDDATRHTPALERLASMARQFEMPVHIAVIPDLIEPSLIDQVLSTPALVPLVHGWRHHNHAPDGAKKSEFGDTRPLQIRRDEAGAGLRRVSQAFAGRGLPVFVPPWNRIGSDLVTELPGLGYRALSTFTPRKAREAAPGLLQINTHLDPIDWHGTRGAVPVDQLVRTACQQLRARRLGSAENGEAFGLLTHHLVHDEGLWDLVETLLDIFCSGPTEAINLQEVKGEGFE